MKHADDIRREYGTRELNENNISSNPFTQFEIWFNEAINANITDASAMVLATVDDENIPDTRVVLLKFFDPHGFIFFTHYSSPKAIQAEQNGHVALNFYWAALSRQVRIRGYIERTSREISVEYFQSRPKESQIVTFASNQSAVIPDRDSLNIKVEILAAKYQNESVPCPEDWGGFRVLPFEFEFFQGRNHRLNDRIRYKRNDNKWEIERLSP